MATRVHKALSMMPEDLERLQKLSAKAGMSESQYIRSLLKVQEAKLEGREDELRIMSDRENKESPSGDEEGGQGTEARFLTKKLPNYYLNVKIKGRWYWMLFKNPDWDHFNIFAANNAAMERGFEYHGTYELFTPEELLAEIEKEKRYEL